MNIDETRQLLKVVAGAFPNWKVPDKTITLEIWQEVLAEYPLPAVASALKIFIKTDTKGFAPAPGQLIDIMHSKASNHLGNAEAWAMVRRAISNGTYGYKEEYDKLPAEVQRAVGSAEQLKVWATDTDYNESVISSNFKRNYEVTLNRVNEEAKIPLALKQNIEILLGGENADRLLGCSNKMSIL